MNVNQILCGDAKVLAARLKAETLHTMITSPPYYGHRTYHLEPVVWGGSEDCDHVWEPSAVAQTKNSLQGSDEQEKYAALVEDEGKGEAGSVCKLCGAWMGTLGQEPTPAAYIDHLTDVFSRLMPALRPDGTLWIIIGDSYSRGRVGDIKPKDLMLIPDMLRLSLRAAGWWIRATGPWLKYNAMPETSPDRPVRGHESVILCTKNAAKPVFWTHEERRGTRKKPESEWFWLSKKGQGRQDHRPTGAQSDGAWVRKNRWVGHDYYFDDDAVRVPYDKPLNRWGGNTWEVTDTSEYRLESGEPVDKIIKHRPDDSGRRWRSSDFWAEAAAWSFDPECIAFVDNTYSFKGAHFATFPPTLIAKMIRVATPAKACAGCAAPYAANVRYTGAQTKHRWGDSNALEGDQGYKLGAVSTGMINEKEVVGWQPTCDCPGSDTSRPVVFDPFMGSGTVAWVASLLGRHYLGFEANPDYVEMSEERIKTRHKSDVAGRILADQCQPTLF